MRILLLIITLPSKPAQFDFDFPISAATLLGCRPVHFYLIKSSLFYRLKLPILDILQLKFPTFNCPGSLLWTVYNDEPST